MSLLEMTAVARTVVKSKEYVVHLIVVSVAEPQCPTRKDE